MELQEQMEWKDLNKLLQHRGFKPVRFADPVENKNLPDLVLLDKKCAGEMRATLRRMLDDSERRQALIQQLNKSNNQLMEEAQEQARQAAQYRERTAQLEALLEGVKTRVQDLETRFISRAAQQHSGATQQQQLQQEKQEALSRCRALEESLSQQRESAARLQKKLHFAVREEERRQARQSRAFQDVCNRACQQNSPVDQQTLDVMDFYEARMGQLLDELRSGRRHPDQAKARRTGRGPAASFKSVLMSFQDQQKDCRGQLAELKTEVDSLKQTLETRSPREDTPTPTREAVLCARYQQLLGDISAVLTNPAAPTGPPRPFPVGGPETDFQGLVPTLELWAQQLCLLKDLEKGLNKLSSRLVPWQPPRADGGSPAKVEDLILLVDSMLGNTETDDGKVLRSPTRHALSAIVSHFQTLFDVKSLQGVYPRMNELYTRLGEATNAMRSLRDVLELDGRVSPAEVVDHVARLASSGRTSLLGEADLDSVIVKVRQHEEFFPAFHALVLDVLDTLGVGGLDDILPALRALKEAP